LALLRLALLRLALLRLALLRLALLRLSLRRGERLPALPRLLPQRRSLTSLAGLPGRDSNEFLQSRLDVPLAVMCPVRDPLYEIVDVDGGVKVRRTDLGELVKNPVPDLPPVLPQLLLDLLGLLLLHVITPSLGVAHLQHARNYSPGHGGQPSASNSRPVVLPSLRHAVRV
jgi:hypothetical protein